MFPEGRSKCLITPKIFKLTVLATKIILLRTTSYCCGQRVRLFYYTALSFVSILIQRKVDNFPSPNIYIQVYICGVFYVS